MTSSPIAHVVDHTNLRKDATEEDIKKLCSEAVRSGARSVCVAPYYVKTAYAMTKDTDVRVTTVIGFPNGYILQEVKITEALYAISDGADDIDMVINVCELKNKEYEKITSEINDLATICHNSGRILKVIIETCLLDDDEIRKMCEICISAGADFIKTSTGFDKKGASVHDILIMKDQINGRQLKIKAAGGIHTKEEAEALIEAGADVLGASNLLNI